jgi:hypothetical protein
LRGFAVLRSHCVGELSEGVPGHVHAGRRHHPRHAQPCQRVEQGEAGRRAEHAEERHHLRRDRQRPRQKGCAREDKFEIRRSSNGEVE